MIFAFSTAKKEKAKKNIVSLPPRARAMRSIIPTSLHSLKNNDCSRLAVGSIRAYGIFYVLWFFRIIICTRLWFRGRSHAVLNPASKIKCWHPARMGLEWSFSRWFGTEWLGPRALFDIRISRQVWTVEPHVVHFNSRQHRTPKNERRLQS